MAYETFTNIDERVLRFAEYMLETQCTVRAAAKHFGFSKSTVHKDVSIRLKNINYELYRQICTLLDTNLNERHIRGGNATKLKYTELKKNEKKHLHRFNVGNKC